MNIYFFTTGFRLMIWMPALLVLGLRFPASGQPALPEVGLYLNAWRMDGGDWLTTRGTAPQAWTNVQAVPTWNTNAARFAGTNQAYLRYDWVGTNGITNVTVGRGSLWMWYRPYQWSGTNLGGTGPGHSASLVELGAFNSNGWFSLHVNPAGDKLIFASQESNAIGGVWLQADAILNTNWTFIVLNYSSSNSFLFTNGVLAASGSGVTNVPSAAVCSNGVFFGSDFAGSPSSLAMGDLELVRAYDGPMPESLIYGSYTNALAKIQTWESGGGGEGLMGGGGDGLVLDDGGGSGLMDGGEGGESFGPATNGLRFSPPGFLGTNMVSTILGGEEGWWYDIFRATSLVGNAMVNSTWTWAGQGTNNGSYLLPYVSSPHAFHMLGSWEDTDFDGLSDAFEKLISRTSTNSVDTDLDGVFDADELGANGLPHFASHAGMTRAVIFTTSGTATEGGGEGQIKIRLPSPAPTNGTTVVIHHGGTAEHEADYRLLKTDGTPITNDVVFSAGATEMTLRVQAINDTQQSTQPRRVSLALAQSANYELDWRRADVTLLENDLPLVSVVAADSAAGEPGTNTNPGAFLISREGSNTLALSVGFTLSGSATVTTDYTASNSPIIIPAGSNSLTIPVNPVHDTNYEGNETVVLTLQSSSAYAIASNAATGAVTIAENDLPLVYLVGTDLVATEYNSLNPATVTMRRTGNASQPLTVPLAIAGTAGATDYQTVPGVIIFATNQTETNITVRPLADTIEEQAETVILTIKGSLSYNVGSSNSVTVHIDDDTQPRYEIVQLKPSSSYHTAHNIDSPAVFDIKRHGRSDAAVNLPFQIVTNQFTPSTFYRVYGDVSGANAVFPAFATKARLNFTAPVTGKTNGSIEFRMTNVDAATYAIWFRPAWDYVEFKVIDTNGSRQQSEHKWRRACFS
jgi:hypothetical protein